ncbi:MAG: class I SAM-dependent methyltransferase [Actinobacteria bacterium]|nr:class I SAM-dependent methyltransferase [Actinomycetota bacterium]
MTLTFNPVQYKTTTRQQWQDAAEAWHRWAPTLEAWLGEATELMLDEAGIGIGSHVLDVAAGAGGQTLAAARRVGPTGRVLATDISPAILTFAASEAARAGATNVATRELDGENLDLPEGTFDAVVSRVGLIYFPDQQGALAGMHRVLRPGGRVGAVVYSTATNNEFFSIPVSIIRRRANLPPPAVGQPGPFSLGSPGVIEDALTAAGFSDVRTHRVAAPLRMPSAAECVRFERESFGALHQMLSALDATEREDAWDEIVAELARFEAGDGFEGPCELIVASGAKGGTDR